jgi:hypothetical protein
MEYFEAFYDYATKESKHTALIIDNHNRVNKELMFRQNWNTLQHSFKNYIAPPAASAE